MSISPEFARVYSALPTRTIDLIRRGVTGPALRAGGDRAVWAALVSTAESAHQHGHTYTDWAGVVGERRSRLGHQARLKGGKTDVGAVRFERQLRRAWAAAETWLENEAAPAFTREDIVNRAHAVRDWCADADSPISDTDRAVLAYAAEVAERNGTTRPTMPWREVRDATGLGERAVKNALERLHKAGLLVLEVRGAPGGPDSTTRRASAYQLAAAGTLAAQSRAAEAAVEAPVERPEPPARVTPLRRPQDVLAARVQALSPAAMAEVEAVLVRVEAAPEGTATGGAVVSMARYRRDA